MLLSLKRPCAKPCKPFLLFAVVVFLLSSGPGTLLRPLPAQAATNAPLAPDQTSADASKEIVYIDANGVIRVVDLQSTGGPLVDWSSDLDKNSDGSVHGTNFRDFALGDVNNDGDMEIIAIKGGSADGELVVYDPVIAPGQPTKANQKSPNGIPWDKLYDVTLKGKPVLVGAGNFDVNVPGDEIIYFYELNAADKKDSTDNQRMVILKATSTTPTGRTWQEHDSKVFSNNWQTLAVGNFDGSGADEIVMVDDDSTGGELNVFRVDSGIARIGKAKGSDSAPWKYATFGQWDGGGKKELLAVRESNGLPSFYVWQWDGDGKDFKEQYSEAFAPGPRFIVMADINADKKQEAFLLRSVPSGTKIARLIPRGDDQGEIPSEMEQRLDTDSGYRSGAGGDIDGDGREELVLIRDNKMMIFDHPENSGNSTTRDVTTNRRSIAIGDLDRNGYAVGAQFCVNKTTLSGQLPVGIVGTPVADLQLTNCGSTDATPFTISVDGSPSWFQVSPTTALTPSTLTYNFSAQNLAPGVYTTTLRIDSTAVVVNKPFLITLSLTVTGAEVKANPSGLVFNYSGNCITTTTSIMTQTISMAGSPGVHYTAAIVASPDVAAAEAALSGPIDRAYINAEGMMIVRDAAGHEATVTQVGPKEVSASSVESTWPSGVPWLKASSKSDLIPDTITLNADPQIATNQTLKQALLVIIADAQAGVPPNNVRIVPIYMLCTRSQIQMPIINR